jgi:hypothetical protein
MSAALLQIFRSRWFVVSVHVALWLLLYLAVSRMGGKAPEYYAADASGPSGPSLVPVVKLDSLFAPERWPKPSAQTNLSNLFFTKHFVPPPTPAPPPPPTTKKIEVTYQGFYEGVGSVRNVIVKVVDAFVIARVGMPIATNWFVADATMQQLTLTNLVPQTNLISLNAKKEIEVPVK